MTESATDVALRYVREELGHLRSTVQSEVSGVRADFASLAGELRAHMSEQAPRQAVVEHRLSEAERDIQAVGEEVDRLREEKTDESKVNKTAVVAIIVAIIACIPDLIKLLGG